MYGFLKALALPPTNLLLLIFLGLAWWRRPLLGRGLVWTGALGLLGLSLPFVAGLLMTPLEPYPALTEADLQNSGAQAIVVLSGRRDDDAPEYGGDTLGDFSLLRIRYGAWLQRRTGLPLFVTGGRAPNEFPSHAELMRQVLEQEFGVEVQGLEEHARNTWENGAFTARLLEQRGLHHVYLVTHAWHLPRAIAAFERVGVKVTPAPLAFAHDDDDEIDWGEFLPDIAALHKSYYAFHEYLGRLWYRVRDALE